MLKHTKIFVTVVLVLFCCNTGYAAQSTSDVPVTAELLENARSNVLGKQVKNIKSEDEYVIGHGDIISIQVYGEGDMSAAVPSPGIDGQGEIDPTKDVSGVVVRIDGRISLKHLGDIEAIGFTLTQLADYLKQLYATVFDDPVITVVLVRNNSKKYTVMGKVTRPGIYLVDSPLNIVQVIARCGGFTEWAKSEVTIIRKNPQKNRRLFKGNKLIFDYGDFLDGEQLERNIYVKADDIIIVH